MTDALYTVIAHIRPKPGAEARLLDLRPILDQEFATLFDGVVSSDLYRVEGSDEWRDVVVFDNRSAIDETHDTPAYTEWSSLIDFLSYEILEPLG